MRKLLLLLTILSVSCVSSLAQSSMTDSQIIDFVVREQANGTSQSQIVTRLMQRGVKIDQIRSIQQKMKLEQGGSLNAKDLISTGHNKYDRSRSRSRTVIPKAENR